MLSDLWWSFTLAWKCSSSLVIWIVVTALARGLTPVAMAITGRGMVNAVSYAIQTGTTPTSLQWWIAAGLGIAILESVSRFANLLWVTLLEQKLELRINSDILAHADELELWHFEDPRFQDTLDRAREHVAKNLLKSFTATVAALIDTIQVVTLVVLLAAIVPIILVFIVPLSVPYLLYQWNFSKRRAALIHSRARKSRWTRYFIRQLTTSQAVAEVKSLGLAPVLRQQYTDIVSAFLREDRGIHLRKFRFDVIYVVVSTTAAYAAFFRVAIETLGGRMTVGDVAIFGAAALKLATGVQSLVNHCAWVREHVHHASNLREYLDIPPAERQWRGETPAGCRGEFELQDVTFSYPGSDSPALSGISLRIRAGETVALVGENGSGKTTLAKLLAGLYEPSAGRVLLDGRPIGTLSREFLRRHVSMVFQEYARYEATVAENIAYGDWKRSLNDSRLTRRAAALAGVEDLIAAMPRGYDTTLGREFGEYTLSVGQWQQLALARAMAKDAAVLVLDEPTASLDALAERRLAEHFAEIAKGRTTVLISHRFSTIGIADRIIVFADGRIVEQGTHEELLVANGRYAELHDTYHSPLRAREIFR